MKVDATLEDFKKREEFLINYLENQIWNLEVRRRSRVDFITVLEIDGKISAYKDMLFKLKKDEPK